MNAVQVVDQSNPYVRGEWMALPFGQYVKRKSPTSIDLRRIFDELKAPNMQFVTNLASSVGILLGVDPKTASIAVYATKLVASVTSQLRDIYRLDLNPIQLRVGAFVALLDQAELQQPFDGAVEDAGAHTGPAVGVILDGFHDGVAVLLAVCEGQQDVEDGGREREQVLRLAGLVSIPHLLP